MFPYNCIPPDASARAVRRVAPGRPEHLHSDATRIATRIDVELQVACRTEAADRAELGRAAYALLHGRRYRRLGFVRLSDYARERLGVTERTLQLAAWVAARLDRLPETSTAFDRSDISWSQARAICAVATRTNERDWLLLAARTTVAQLEAAVRRARRPNGVRPDPAPDTVDIDGEPTVRWRLACPAVIAALWRYALRLAERVAGEPLAEWRAVEIIAAEGFAGRPLNSSFGERGLLAALRRQRLFGTITEGLGARSCQASDRSAASVTPAERMRTRDDHESNATGMQPDPFALDARLRAAIASIQKTEPRIGRLLRMLNDHHLHRLLGFRSLDAYVRDRLGISPRKAWALLRVERATLRNDVFGRAYHEGRLSWVRALALLPVADSESAAAWIERAENVSVRRLCDEVEWTLETRDVLGSRMPLEPPPLDAVLHSPIAALLAGAAARNDRRGECRERSLDAALQTCARFESLTDGGWTSTRDATVTFTAPASVVTLLRDVLDAFAPPEAPRWVAVEALLRRVIDDWEDVPRHRDPIFARDGWRCTVPACSSRRNLHDHHLQFRSRGGGNAHDNRTTVCAAHHLHGIHAGVIRASGTAPGAVRWELGVRAGAPPLATYVGDRRCG